MNIAEFLLPGMPGIKKKRVFVGLSGGVDSSVAAALLKQQGYEVAGVFMRFWRPRIDADSKTADRRGGENSCCSVESEASALAVAQKLGIPFYVFNFEREFKKAVVDYFLRELASGRTPNPCVVCNPQIKFGLFLERARKLGADYISTGHYARTAVVARSAFASLSINSATKQSRTIAAAHGIAALPSVARNDTVKLFAAKDKKKDQSYFLHRLTQKQLSRVLLPLAGYTKAEVYKLARKWRLPHQAHQSFDICFAGDYQKFLKKHLKLKPGKIVKIANDTNGGSNITNKNLPQPLLKEGSSLPLGRVREDLVKVLGTHQGLPFYTIGQRASIGGPGPFFVIKKEVKKNILYVSNNESDLYQKETEVENVNWISGKTPKLPLRCKIRIRYGGEAASAVIATPPRRGKQSRSIAAVHGIAASLATLAPRNDTVKVIFTKPQRAITPGQSAVFYGRDGEVLGGGIIK